MKTLRISILPLLIASGFFFQGCGTTEVAKAQQVTHAAAVDFNAFIQFEKANRDQLWKINHGIKQTADKLRHKTCDTCEPNAAKWVNSAIAMIDAYKNARTPENKANMATAIAVLQELANQITQYFLDPQVRSIDPAISVKYGQTKIVP
jgi:hypothetical protein